MRMMTLFIAVFMAILLWVLLIGVGYAVWQTWWNNKQIEQMSSVQNQIVTFINKQANPGGTNAAAAGTNAKTGH